MHSIIIKIIINLGIYINSYKVRAITSLLSNKKKLLKKKKIQSIIIS